MSDNQTKKFLNHSSEKHLKELCTHIRSIKFDLVELNDEQVKHDFEFAMWKLKKLGYEVEIQGNQIMSITHKRTNTKLDFSTIDFIAKWFYGVFENED